MIIPLHAGRRSLMALAALLGTRLSSSVTPYRLVTRSNEVREGDLFCALRGRDDGHFYTREAYENGACAVLVERTTDVPCPHIIVSDVRRALSLWASVTLHRHACTRIGITGSVGKTTTKNAAHAVLSKAFRVHATPGNFNNELGLPFTVLSMPVETEILIAELGTNAPGEIAALSAVLLPHRSLITRIGHAHLGAFGSRAAIADEKSALFRMTAPSGHVFYPADEPLLARSCLPHQKRHPITSASNDELGLPLPLHSPLRAAFSFAAALGRSFNVPEDSIHKGLIAAHDLQSKPIEAARGIRLIDDTYNASPESMVAALRCLKEYTGGRRVAVLGQMAELGTTATAWHKRIGRLAAESADIFLCFGPYAAAYASGAAECPHCTVLVHSSADSAAIASRLAPLLQEKDTVLFKASHAEHAEDILHALLNQLSEKEEPPCP